MQNIKEKPESYDVVVCLFESFRYIKNYSNCEKVMNKVWKSLKPKGLFIVDFGYWPPTRETKIHNKVKMNALTIIKDEIIRTKGIYDERFDMIKIYKKGKIETKKIKRAPLLRISKTKMQKMLLKTKFKILEIIPSFRGHPQSMLFIAQKKEQ